MRRLVVGAALVVLIAGAAIGVEFSGGPGTSLVADHPYRFVPVAASFVSPSYGVELGYVNCHYCAVLRVTRDGGKTWSLLASQHPYIPLDTRARRAASDLAFATRSGGWLFGPGLWDTDSGGHAFGLEIPGPVVTVEAGRGYAYAITEHNTFGQGMLWRTPVGNEHWSRIATPTRARDILLAVSGDSLMLLQAGFQGPGPGFGGKLWYSPDRGRRWAARPVPCRRTGGAAPVVSVEGRPGSWLLECFSNDQSSQEQRTTHRLYLSRDNGQTWHELAVPTRQGAPVVLGGAGNHFFLGTESGGIDELVGSFDGGRHWHVLLSHGGFLGWSDLHFVDARTGFIVGPNRGGPGYASRNRVYRTDDGGRHWRLLG